MEERVGYEQSACIHRQAIYSETSLTRTHPFWMKLQIKRGNWINEGAVVQCTVGLLQICFNKTTVEDEGVDIRGAGK